MKLKVLTEEIAKDKKESEVVIDSTIHGAEPAPYVDAIANSEKNKQTVAAKVAEITPKEPVTGRVEKDNKVPESADLKAMKLENFKTFMGDKYKGRITEDTVNRTITINTPDIKEIKELIKEAFKEKLSYDVSKIITEDINTKPAFVFVIKEALNENDNQHVIHTGLKHPLDLEVLDSVLGQMSDGIWEDSPSMEKYWGHVDFEMIDGEVCIVVDDSWNSGFRGKTDDEIRKYFAVKIKQVVKEEINDGANIEWTRNSKEHLDYMHDSVTVGDCYRVYDALLGRQNRSDSPDTIILKPTSELKAGDKIENGKVVKSVVQDSSDHYWYIVTYEDNTTDKSSNYTKFRVLKEAVTEAKAEDKAEDKKEPEAPKAEDKKDIVVPEAEKTAAEVSTESTPAPTLPGPQEGPDVGVASMLNTDVIGEWKTIDEYHSHIATIDNAIKNKEIDIKIGKAIKDILTDITNEENIHIGQLQKALSLISPNVNSINTGEKEATEKIDNTIETQPEKKVEETNKESK